MPVVTETSGHPCAAHWSRQFTFKSHSTSIDSCLL